jgi:hypothetical protein
MHRHNRMQDVLEVELDRRLHITSGQVTVCCCGAWAANGVCGQLGLAPTDLMPTTCKGTCFLLRLSNWSLVVSPGGLGPLH